MIARQRVYPVPAIFSTDARVSPGTVCTASFVVLIRLEDHATARATMWRITRRRRPRTGGIPPHAISIIAPRSPPMASGGQY
jgi:hypothetical protein